MVGIPSPQCHPSVIGSMPLRIRKICEALETIYEFSDQMETYLEEKGKYLACNQHFFSLSCSCRSTIRQVDDLANLRFGKFTIWQINNLANLQFGQLTIWQIYNLAIIQIFQVNDFGNFMVLQIWDLASFRNRNFTLWQILRFGKFLIFQHI